MAFKMKGSPMARNYGAPFEKHGGPHDEDAVDTSAKVATADPDFWKTAEDGSMVNKHYYVNKNSPNKDKIDAGWIKAEDGTYVPPNYYKK